VAVQPGRADRRRHRPGSTAPPERGQHQPERTAEGDGQDEHHLEPDERGQQPVRVLGTDQPGRQPVDDERHDERDQRAGQGDAGEPHHLAVEARDVGQRERLQHPNRPQPVERLAGQADHQADQGDGADHRADPGDAHTLMRLADQVTERLALGRWRALEVVLRHDEQ